MKIFDLTGFPLWEAKKKWRRIMRLTLFLMVGFLVTASAANSYSQTTRLSINIKDGTVIELMKFVEKNSEYVFLYKDEDLNLEKKITVEMENATVQQILDAGFAGQDVGYDVYDRQIVIHKTEKLRIPARTIQQQTVTGVVTEQNGQPLPGVTVVVKGTTTGTVTNADGNFTLTLPSGAEVLQFSFVGMRTQEIPIEGRTTFTVVMEEETIGLEEVVAIGYGVQKKVNLTGAVDVVSNELIESRATPTVSQLLQGTSSSLSFNIDNNGFQPGAKLGIQIRGMGSISGGEPYVVIDGIPGDLNRINPEDIESITILKDAASSAIYGARAPYGVIIITTKSGKKGERLKVVFTTNLSNTSPQRLPSQLDSYTTARVVNEAGVNAGGRYFSNKNVDNIIAFQEGNFELIKSRPNFPQDAIYFETTPDPNNLNMWGYNQNGNANRNWVKEFYGTGFIQKHDLTISGGSENISYYFSGGLLEQTGVIRYGTDTYDRYNLSGKITTALNKFWDFTYQPRLSVTIRELPNMDQQGEYDLIFHQILRTMPNMAKYDGYGNYMESSRIPSLTDGGTDITETYENWHTFFNEIRPLKGWKINTDIALQNVDYLYRKREFVFYEHLVDKSIVSAGKFEPSEYRVTHRSNNYWTINAYTSYNFNINEEHNFSFLLGTQFEKTKNRELSSHRINFIVQEVPSLNTADGEISSSENLLSYSTEGFFGRFNYNYKEKYLLEGNARYDGSSRFKKGNRWGFFPSFSFGWNMHYENFWKNISGIINTFKIRGSWGELGNQNVSPFQDLLLIPLSSSALNWIFDQGGSRPIGFADTPNLISANLTWETSMTKDLGLDLSFMQGRLQTNLDFFQRITYDMIGPAPAQPGVLGSTVPKENNATLNSKGWEINLSWKDQLPFGLVYNIGLNLYDSKAKVTKYYNPTGLLSDWYEGKEEGEIWGYTVYDLFRTQEDIDNYVNKVDLSEITGLTWRTGDVKYEDINGDSKVNAGSNTLNDHGDLSIIGNSTPHYQYGINLSLSYKRFYLSTILRGVGKRDVLFGPNDNVFWGFRGSSQWSILSNHLNYFRDIPGDTYTGLYEGDKNFNIDAYYPRPYLDNTQNAKNRLPSTRYLQNGSYLRMQNLQIGYNLPDKLVSKIKLTDFNINLSGENIFTIQCRLVKDSS